MATLLGTINFDTYANFQLSYTLDSQSVANNTSTLTFYGTLNVTGNSIGWSNGNCWVHWSKNNNLAKRYTRGSYQLVSGTYTFTHNADGNLTINVGYGISTTYKSGSSSVNITLPKIPRYTSITRFDVTAKDETTLHVDWASSDSCDYAWYSLDGGSTWTDSNSTSFDIAGLKANTTYNVKIRVRRRDSQLTTDSWNVSQTTYDYPHAISVDKNPLTIGDKQTVTLYNPLKRSIQVHFISGTVDGYTSAENTTGTTSSPFNASTWIDWFYARIPNAQQGTYQIKVVCSSPSHTSTTTDKYTFKVKGTETPTFSNYTFQDINSTTTAVTGNNQYFIKGLSQLRAVVSTANKMIAKNYATAKIYTAAIDGKSVNANYSSNANVNLDIGTLPTAGTRNLSVSATDSRGLITTVSKNVTVIDYAEPVINATATRQNNFEATTTLKIAGIYSLVKIGNANKNTIKTVRYHYKESTASTYGNWVTLTPTLDTTNGKYSCPNQSISFTITKSYNIQIEVTDNLKTTTVTLSVSQGTPFIFISSSGSVEFNYDLYINKRMILKNNGAQGMGIANSSGKSIIRDHGNNNVTVDATGGTLFLGYETTKSIDILKGKASVTANGGIKVSSDGIYVNNQKVIWYS